MVEVVVDVVVTDVVVVVATRSMWAVNRARELRQCRIDRPLTSNQWSKGVSDNLSYTACMSICAIYLYFVGEINSVKAAAAQRCSWIVILLNNLACQSLLWLLHEGVQKCLYYIFQSPAARCQRRLRLVRFWVVMIYGLKLGKQADTAATVLYRRQPSHTVNWF